MNESPLALIIVFNVVIGWAIGRSKQREGAGAFYGLILGPLGWVIMILLPNAGQKCPHCGGMAKKGAMVCCHCGRDLVKRREPALICPMCSRAISKKALHVGMNTCPFCGEVFEVES